MFYHNLEFYNFTINKCVILISIKILNLLEILNTSYFFVALFVLFFSFIVNLKTLLGFFFCN